MFTVVWHFASFKKSGLLNVLTKDSEDFLSSTMSLGLTINIFLPEQATLLYIESFCVTL